MFKRPPSSQQPPTLYAFPESNRPAAPNSAYPYENPQYPYQRPSAPPLASGYSSAGYRPPVTDPRWHSYQAPPPAASSSWQAQSHLHARANSYSAYGQPKPQKMGVPYPSQPRIQVPPPPQPISQPVIPGQTKRPHLSSYTTSPYPPVSTQQAYQVPGYRPPYHVPAAAVPVQQPASVTRQKKYSQEFINSLPPLPPGLKYFNPDAETAPDTRPSSSGQPPRPASRQQRTSSSAHLHHPNSAVHQAQGPAYGHTRQRSSSSVQDHFAQQLHASLSRQQSASSAQGRRTPVDTQVSHQASGHRTTSSSGGGGRPRSSSTRSNEPPAFIPPPSSSFSKVVCFAEPYHPTGGILQRKLTPKMPMAVLPDQDEDVRGEDKEYRPSEIEKMNTEANSKADLRHLWFKQQYSAEAPPVYQVKRQYLELNYELLPTFQRDLYPHVEWYCAFPPTSAVHHIGPTKQKPLDLMQYIVHPPRKLLFINTRQNFMYPSIALLKGYVEVRKSTESITVGDVFQKLYEHFRKELMDKDVQAVKEDEEGREIYELMKRNRQERLRRGGRSGSRSGAFIIQDMVDSPIKFNGFVIDGTFDLTKCLWLVVDRLAPETHF
ncbi:hypothetical protein CPC08DRAFT_766794 [Agrocybe pediades]|nr:hypothetical protein CPC08DRAFT_766794 [Agrocybe pediades]